jgi:hypothetical protein
VRRHALECREALEILLHREGSVDLEHAQTQHANKAECPARSLSDHSKPSM